MVDCELGELVKIQRSKRQDRSEKEEEERSSLLATIYSLSSTVLSKHSAAGETKEGSSSSSFVSPSALYKQVLSPFLSSEFVTLSSFFKCGSPSPSFHRVWMIRIVLFVLSAVSFYSFYGGW